MQERDHNPRVGGSSPSSVAIYDYYRTGYILNNSN